MEHLTQKDLETIERIAYKTTDDIAVSIMRTIERLEDHIDALEARQYVLLQEIKDLLKK